MKKFNLFMLPLLLAMQEGEQPEKTRDQLFIEGLGLSDDVRSIISDKEADIGDAVKKFTEGYSSIVRQNHSKSWDEDLKKSIIKETQTGSHKAFQKKLKGAFEFLDLEKFKDEEKPTEAIIKAISEHHKAEAEKYKKGGNGDIVQLQEQLSALNKEKDDLLKQVEGLPTKIQEAIIVERNGRIVDNSIAKSIKSVRKSVVDIIDDDTLEQAVRSIVKVEVVREEGKDPALVIKDKRTDKLFMKSRTENYTNLNDLVMKEIVEKKNWQIKSSGKPTDTKHTQTDGEGDKKKGIVNKKALEHAKKYESRS